MHRTHPLVMVVLLAACVGDVATRPLPHGSVQANPGTSRSGGQLVVWGEDGAQQISKAPIHDNIRAIAPGGAKQALAIRHDGSLVMWGGVGEASAMKPIPFMVADSGYVDVAVTISALWATRLNHAIVTWGSFLSGLPADPPAGLRARAVAGGAGHGLALRMDGTLEPWGSGTAGTTAPAGKFRAVSGRSNYSIALRLDGTLFGWGENPAVPDRYKGWQRDAQGFFFVPNERFVAIAAGNTHILALRADGSVAGWGTNVAGSIHAPAGVRFTAIAAGLDYSLGLDKQGTIHHWGDPSAGRGNVPRGRFVAIAAGTRHASALRANDPASNHPRP